MATDQPEGAPHHTGAAAYHAVDADGHVFEPEELWAEYLPVKFRDRRPRIIRDNRGTTRYLIEGRLSPVAEGRGAWVPEGFVEASCKRPGGTDPKARLADMDAEGVEVAVLYGTLGLGLWSVQDREFSAALCRAWNDWARDYCSAAPGRLKATVALPLQDMNQCLTEARRAVLSLGAVALPVPASVMGNNPDHPYVHPLYALAQDLDVPIGFHAGAGGIVNDRFVNSYALAHACAFTFDAMLMFATVIGGGVLERFPRLRVAFLEGGCGWLPYWTHRIDEHFEKRPAEFPHIKGKPSEYLQQGRVFVSCDPDEPELGHVAARMGSDCLVYASDYPHWDAMFPGSVAAIAGRADLSGEQKRAILSANARRLMKLD
jgi:hypothetical protein